MRIAGFVRGIIVTMALSVSADALVACESVARNANLAQQVSASQSEPQSGGQRMLEIPQTLGPFSFAGQTFSVVLRQKFLPDSPDPKLAQSLASLEVQDATGTVLYQKTFPYTVSDGHFTRPVTAFAQLLVGIGDTWFVESRKIGTKWWLSSYTAMLISYTGLPADSASQSAPELNGEAWQVFGMKDGKLQLLDAPSNAEMMLGNSAPYAIVWGTGGISVDPMAPSSAPSICASGPATSTSSFRCKFIGIRARWCSERDVSRPTGARSVAICAWKLGAFPPPPSVFPKTSSPTAYPDNPSKEPW